MALKMIPVELVLLLTVALFGWFAFRLERRVRKLERPNGRLNRDD